MEIVAPGKGGERIRLTPEQQAIIESEGNIKINAVAGSGKTTTIIQYAASRPPGSRILYLAFNRSVRLEAQARFRNLGIKNVQVETAHSLAYKAIVLKNHYTVCQNDYKPYELAEILGFKIGGDKHDEFILANHAGKFITYFCNSLAEKVQDLNYLDVVHDELAKNFVTRYYRQIEKGARMLLAMMHRGEMEITHDFYLKLFQLSKPALPYDYILFDEGQDASPAMLDIFLRQKATKLIVGDTHQQIYSWRHAVNSLERVDFTPYQLSTSFRFGQDIAKLAIDVLAWKRHFQELGPVSIAGMGKQAKITSRATIARSNLGLLLQAIHFITDNKQVKHIYFEGNLNSYTYADEGASLYDVLHLYNGRRARIRDKLIASMSNLEELEDYIEKTEDVQLAMMVEIVREYGNEIPSLIQSLKSKHVSDEDKSLAEMIFSTVHRAKGMEYDSVELVEDFMNETRLKKLLAEAQQGETINFAKLNEEVNLLYVAATRSRNLLIIPDSLCPQGLVPSPGIRIAKARSRPESATGEEETESQRPVPGRKSRGKNELSYAEQRLKHKNAYERWTIEADAELRQLYEQGARLSQIASHFKRNRGAILSRLKKIGCITENDQG